MSKEATIRGLLQIFVRRFGILDASITNVCCENISIAQSHILYEIERQPNSSMQQIAEVLGTDITTFSRQIKSLERKSLIEKNPDREDRRFHRLSLTSEGKRIKKQIDHKMHDYINQVFSHMSEFEREIVVQSIKLLNDALLKTGKAPK
ncbi:MAG TPA: MarR family transcriptional regulator [Anaerolineae bacterium]|nr:MarR family transcriptional regulator [Anaerolineae bacterium]